MQDEPEDRYSSLYPEGYHVAGTVKRLKGHGYIQVRWEDNVTQTIQSDRLVVRHNINCPFHALFLNLNN